MTDTIRRILNSRKVQVAMLAGLTNLLVYLAQKYGLPISEEQAGRLASDVLMLAGLVIGGIAVEDAAEKHGTVVMADAPEEPEGNG